MPSGGARNRSGPAPDPQALRRDRDGQEWLTLPASGLQDVPEFPLVDESDREHALWLKLWQERPQAHEWQRLGLHLEVAMYVRKLAEAESHESSAATATLVRQLGDSLGLSIAGLRVNKWKITGEEVRAQRPQKTRQRRQASARDRLRVIPPVGE